MMNATHSITSGPRDQRTTVEMCLKNGTAFLLDGSESGYTNFAGRWLFNGEPVKPWVKITRHGKKAERQAKRQRMNRFSESDADYIDEAMALKDTL